MGRRARAGYFERVRGGGAAIELDTVEISILRSLTAQLLELVGPGNLPEGAADDDADPLAALFADGPTKPPEDPALARLFPSAYEETADAAEFRRFTENDLRARKREDALAVLRALDAGGPQIKLTADEARQWLGTLNDLRLSIGARLEVSEDERSELYHLPDEDPRKPLMLAFQWFGLLQETLLEAIA
ncbi:DUF2017 domain-containing protein [Streptomyces sp. CBMA29]|uniref:DUF2017 domain-containing protein n=1 Tax=Streptomyces sp. CBMA29 TaxID=1896314 RepID=UPI001661C584|nr:DUF2017 domain-containing protein [Streptomyces sp. CBMA29]MBD0736787.1 hypothetical protein [Streptomyces sp. CBMA29]